MLRRILCPSPPPIPQVSFRPRFFTSRILMMNRTDDQAQRLSPGDREAAAISVAGAFIADVSGLSFSEIVKKKNGFGNLQEALGEFLSSDEKRLVHESLSSRLLISTELPRTIESPPPGPDFWSWTPPPLNDNSHTANSIRFNLVTEEEPALGFLSIPSDIHLIGRKPMIFLLPTHFCFQVLNSEKYSLDEVQTQFRVFEVVDHESTIGNLSQCWKESGSETRLDGSVCRWTVIQGVCDSTEWQYKQWEASNVNGTGEIGAEKCLRDASGNIWCDYHREVMWMNQDLMHMEKIADEWRKNTFGHEWQEKSWERLNCLNRSELNTFKCYKIDPSSNGHAHIWNARWGEQFDGLGSCTKYTDKWAERREGDAWTKWGDKCDFNVDLNGLGVEQGETWWKDKDGKSWSRIRGEIRQKSGWVHKFGKSSCGERWDTNEEQERFWFND